MAVEVGRVHIGIHGNARPYRRELRNTRVSTRSATASMQSDFRRTAVSANAVTTSLRGTTAALGGLLGAGALFGGAAGIGTIASFEQALSTVQAVTNATRGEMLALEAQAASLGATTRFSATQAAEAMLALARAGLETNEILETTPRVLNLAQAGALGLGDAADIATNVLAGMQLTIQDLPRVLDVLTATANASNTDVQQLGQAFSYAAPIANQFGLSLEETAAALGLFANNAIKADRGGTALNNILARLANRTTKGEEVLDRYNLSYDDLDVSVRGLIPVLRTLEGAQLSAADSMALFAIRGSTGAAILSGQQKTFFELADAIEASGGEAERVARIMDDNLNGAILAAKSAMEALVLAMGDVGASDGIRDALSVLTDLLRLAAANADVVAIAFIALTARAIAPMVISMGTGLVVAARNAVVALVALQGAAGTAGASLTVLRSGLIALGGPVTLAITAAATAMAIFAVNSKSATQNLDDLDRSLRKITETRGTIRDDVARLTELEEALVLAIEDQGLAAQAAATQEIQAVNQRIAKNRELADLYEAQARARLAQSQAQIQADAEDLNRRLRSNSALENTVQGTLGALNIGGIFDVNGVDPFNNSFNLEARAQSFLDYAAAVQDAGGTLTAFEAETLDQVAAFLELEQRAKGAQEAIDALAAAGEGGTGDGTTTTTTPPTTRTSPGQSPTEDEIARQREILATLEEQQAIQLARLRLQAAEAQGSQAAIQAAEEELRLLERAQAIRELASDLEAGGLSEADAEARATTDVIALEEAERAAVAAETQADQVALLRLLEQQYQMELARAALQAARNSGDEQAILAAERQLQLLEDQLRVEELAAQYRDAGLTDTEARTRAETEVGTVNDLNRTEVVQPQDEIGELEADLRNRTKAALRDAVESGDWSAAFGNALERAANDGLSNAIDQATDLLFDAVKTAFSQGGGGFGGAIASLFGGGKAGGGDVKEGVAYTVGELGEETFVGESGKVMKVGSRGPERFVAPENGVILRNSTAQEGELPDLKEGDVVSGDLLTMLLEKKTAAQEFGGARAAGSLTQPSAAGLNINEVEAPSTSALMQTVNENYQIRLGDIVVQGDATEKTMELIREGQMQIAAQLPNAIRTEVMDGQRRGRFIL